MARGAFVTEHQPQHASGILGIRREAEAHAPPIPPALHQTSALERLQVPRRARLRKTHGDRQFADAAVRLGDGPDEAVSRRDSEAGEHDLRASFFRVRTIHCMDMHIIADD